MHLRIASSFERRVYCNKIAYFYLLGYQSELRKEGQRYGSRPVRPEHSNSSDVRSDVVQTFAKSMTTMLSVNVRVNRSELVPWISHKYCMSHSVYAAKAHGGSSCTGLILGV